MIKRELYLSKLRDSYDSELIKVIIGVRRSGKSVLMTQIIDELIGKGVQKDHIIYNYMVFLIFAKMLMQEEMPLFFSLCLQTTKIIRYHSLLIVE